MRQSGSVRVNRRKAEQVSGQECIGSREQEGKPKRLSKNRAAGNQAGKY